MNEINKKECLKHLSTDTYIISMPFLGVSVGKMAAITLGTVACHFEVLAQLRLVGIGKILQLLLRCCTFVVERGVL
jgi:hypothetical protein